MIGLTARQLQLLRFLAGYKALGLWPPSIEEMRRGLGLKSKSGIHRLLDALQERGCVRRVKHCPRGIEYVAPIAIPRAPDGAPLYAVPGFGE